MRARESHSLQAAALAICVLPLFACEPVPTNAKSYEDCILLATQGSPRDEVLETARGACKTKFPKAFDFDALARKAEASTWAEVAAKPDFVALTEAEKSEAREQYWKDVLMPLIPRDFSMEARAQFDALARRVSKNNSPSAN